MGAGRGVTPGPHLALPAPAPAWSLLPAPSPQSHRKTHSVQPLGKCGVGDNSNPRSGQRTTCTRASLRRGPLQTEVLRAGAKGRGGREKHPGHVGKSLSSLLSPRCLKPPVSQRPGSAQTRPAPRTLGSGLRSETHQPCSHEPSGEVPAELGGHGGRRAWPPPATRPLGVRTGPDPAAVTHSTHEACASRGLSALLCKLGAPRTALQAEGGHPTWTQRTTGQPPPTGAHGGVSLGAPECRHSEDSGRETKNGIGVTCDKVTPPREFQGPGPTGSPRPLHCQQVTAQSHSKDTTRRLTPRTAGASCPARPGRP